MVSPSSSSSDCILDDHNHQNPGRPPPSKPRKNILKESIIVKDPSSFDHRGHNHNNHEDVMMTTMEKQKQTKYDIPAIHIDSEYLSSRSRTPSVSREPSPVPSDSPISSLVQKWREFEATENHIVGGLSRNSSTASSIEASDQDGHSPDTLDASKSYGRGNDKVRVMDIINKLPLVECNKNVRAFSSNGVVCSPRIRGRQALSDLLAKLENDRYSEIEATSKRQLVSNFTKRGCLQSMLKLRLLRLQESIQDKTLQLPEKSASSSNSMNALSERFNPVIAECYDFMKTRHNQVDKLLSNLLKKKASTFNQELQPIKTLDNNLQDETSTSSPQKHAPIQGNMVSSYGEATQKTTKKNHAQSILGHSANEEAVWKEENEKHLGYDGEGREEVCEDRYSFYGINLDWIHDVSRPRSYWDSLRQAWYNEICTTSSKNEIRQLIERGSVANVLASDFRDKMNKIMMSPAVQQRIQSAACSDDDENHLDEESDIIQNHHQHHHQCQPNDEDASKNLNSHYNQEDNVNFGQIKDIPQHHQSSMTKFYDTHGWSSSIKNNSSFEIEVISELKTRMEQMCFEIRELRESLNQCVDVQEKFHKTIKDEVYVALNHSCSSKTKGTDSEDSAAKKGFCSICYEKKVDSVLYRCGHMCACFKCAHELQWGSEKCPICLAQIADVVRVFT